MAIGNPDFSINVIANYVPCVSNWTEKCSMRDRTRTLEWVQDKASESVTKLLVQLTIYNYT